MDPAAASVYFNTPGVASVRWDEEAQVVLVEWEGWANSSEFSALLEAEITALRKHRSSRVLAAGLKRFAVVVPSSVLAELNLKDSLGKVAANALEVAYFATPEEARQWLTR